MDIRIRLIVALALTLLTDYLIYSNSAGCGVTILALVLGAFVFFPVRTELSKCWFWLLLWLIVAVGASYDASTIGQLLLILLGWTILAICLSSQESNLLTGLARGFVGGGRSLIAAPSDLRRYLLIIHSRLTFGLPAVWVFLIPVGLVLIFGLLMIPANLVLAQWTSHVFDEILIGIDKLMAIDEERVYFWIFAGLGIYGLFRFRLGRRIDLKARARRAKVIDARREHNLLRTCTLSFLGLNLLYLLTNGVDLIYLWTSSVQLPEGMTYADFAHQGAYRLIVAVGLAAVTITLFMPTYSKTMNSSLVRALSILFILQNMFLLASAARRLYLYEEVYGLTRFRVAAMLWLALVAVGFFLILIRIVQKRTLWFLFSTNAITTLLLLVGISLANIDGFIADWNVTRYEKGSDEAVDVKYLASLEAAAIPALVRLNQLATAKGNSELADAAMLAAKRKIAIEEKKLTVWQSWTWRREVSVKALD